MDPVKELTDQFSKLQLEDSSPEDKNPDDFAVKSRIWLLWDAASRFSEQYWLGPYLSQEHLTEERDFTALRDPLREHFAKSEPLNTFLALTATCNTLSENRFGILACYGPHTLSDLFERVSKYRNGFRWFNVFGWFMGSDGQVSTPAVRLNAILQNFPDGFIYRHIPMRLKLDLSLDHGKALGEIANKFPKLQLSVWDPKYLDETLGERVVTIKFSSEGCWEKGVVNAIFAKCPNAEIIDFCWKGFDQSSYKFPAALKQLHLMQKCLDDNDL